MATLISPGSLVTVTDESFYASAGSGTIPLVFIATAQDKELPDGSGIAPGTLKANANKLYTITSQRNLIQTFGNPLFEQLSGSTVFGSERNEHGLFALYSYLGLANRAYVVRADVDLNQLISTATEPTGGPVNGTVWLDTVNSVWGVFRANGNAVPGLAWDQVAIVNPSSTDLTAGVPKAVYGSNGQIAQVTYNNTSKFYEKISGAWYLIGHSNWAAALVARDGAGSYTLSLNSHKSVPAGTVQNSIWIKTTTPNFGANWSVKTYNETALRWDETGNSMYTGAVEAEVGLTSIVDNRTFVLANSGSDGTATFQVVQYDAAFGSFSQTGTVNLTTTTIPAAGSFQIVSKNSSGTLGTATVSVLLGDDIDDVVAAVETGLTAAGITAITVGKTATNNLVLTSSGQAFRVQAYTTIVAGDIGITAGEYSAWSAVTYTSAATEPSGLAIDGTMWYNGSSYVVDFMINDGDEWCGLNSVKGQAARDAKFGVTGGSNEVFLTSAEPTTQTDATALEVGDIWIDTSDTVNYPLIRYYDGSDWAVVDKTDQTTPLGILFADARSSDASGVQTSSALLASNYVDPDAPNPQSYAAGMLMFNLRLASGTVRQFNETALTSYTDSYTVGAGSFTKAAVNGTADGRWVTISGLQYDGSPFMLRRAQRNVVVKALQAVVSSNEDIRSEYNIYNLIAAPGYCEVQDEMKTLNIDKKETALIIADTPIRLKPLGTDLQNWATNAAGAASPSEEGRPESARYTYSSILYPWGVGTNIDGTEVPVAPSAMKLRVIAYSDSVAYPWKPAAGVRRGQVSNATGVGYVSDEGEFVTVNLNNGLRDVLYAQGINPITPLPGQGMMVYGQKTQQAASSAMDRENVVRLICYLKPILDEAVRPFIFELNNERVRAEVTEACARVLADIVNKEGIYDFAVVCDTTNNTPTTIDRNELNVDLAISPQKAIEFCYLALRVVNTGEV